MQATRSVFAGVRASSARPVSRSGRRALLVRATGQEQEQAAPSPSGTFFYAGKTYSSEEEWRKALADGSASKPAVTPDYSITEDGPAGAPLSLGALMAFSGPAPELINGRLAMLAFIAALGAELSTGETVLRQLADEPTGIILAALTFITASLIPLLSSTKREPWGPFTPGAEMLNGRAAMIGFASLLVAEAVRGSALF